VEPLAATVSSKDYGIQVEDHQSCDFLSRWERAATKQAGTRDGFS
jgi:hypothetical protein